MTVIRPNSIAGITSIAALGDNISFYNSDGVNISHFNANINATSGVSTIANLTVGFITATSTSITGNVTVGGNASIAGTLTYKDVTNVDSIGIVTARAGVNVTGGSVVINSGGLNVSGVTTVAAGSTSAPSITPSGDSNTGIFFPSADTIAFAEGGTEVGRFDSSGRFGLGTSNPQSLFHINGDTTAFRITRGSSIGFAYNTGTSTTDPFRIQSNGGSVDLYSAASQPITFSAGTTEKARIDGSGRLLIGTSTSRATGSGGAINFVLEAAGTYTQAVFATNQNNSNGAYATFAKSRGSSANSFAAVQLSDEIGVITFEGADGTNSIPAARIAAYVDGTPGANDMPGRLVFSTTADGASSPTERCRISNSGGFSLGTTANPGAGAIFATGDITAFYSSDIRLKKDIEPISEPIKKLMEISGVTYKWNEEYLKDKDVDGYFVRETEVGVIAQEVEKVLPEVVATRENGYKAVRYEKLVALLIEAVKDQQHQIDELKALFNKLLNQNKSPN